MNRTSTPRQHLSADAARAQNDQLIYIEITKREGEFAIQKGCG
jgi:hypothetical protein